MTIMRILSIILVALSFAQCTNKGHQEEKATSEVKTEETAIIKNQQINNCRIELHRAAKSSDVKQLQNMINNGCDANTIIDSKVAPNGDTLNNNALYYTQDYETTKLLLAAGADPNFNQIIGNSVLETAIMLNKNDVAELLLEYEADVNHYNEQTEWNSPLGGAVSTGNIEGLKLLMNNGAVFQKKDRDELIHLAIRYKRYETVKLLLEYGLPINKKSTPFGEEGGFGDCIQCPVNITPLHSAVLLNDSIASIKFIDLLLLHQADLDAKNKYKLSPLALIATDGKQDIARHLIQKGATIDAESILRSAAYQNNEYLEVLLKYGGDANASSDYYESVLFAAVTCCGDGFNESPTESRVQTIELLLSYGAEPSGKLVQLIHDEDRFLILRELFQKYGF